MIITNLTRALLGFLILASLWSLMHAFMGGAVGDFRTLDSMQFSGILFSVLACVVSVALLSRPSGIGSSFKLAWMHVPGWMVFAAGVIVSLSVIGELSYYLLRDAAWIPADWFNHSALICLALACLAFLLVSGAGHLIAGKPPYSKARW